MDETDEKYIQYIRRIKNIKKYSKNTKPNTKPNIEPNIEPKNAVNIKPNIKPNIKSDFDIDMHEWLKSVIKSTGDNIAYKKTEPKSEPIKQNKLLRLTKFFNNDLPIFRRLLTPKSLYKRTYILLDTSTANAFSSGSRFRWNFSPNADLELGTINAIGEIKNLIAMRCLPITTQLTSDPSHRAFLPMFPSTIYTESSAGTGPIYNNDFVNLNHNFTILIEEFSAQAYVGREGRKFHFVFFPVLMNPNQASLRGDLSTTVLYPSLSPYYEFVGSGKGNGWFWFRKPFSEFSTLTMSMANPFELIPLSKTTRTLIPIEMIYLGNDYEI